MQADRPAEPPTLHVLARGDGWLVVAKPPRLLVHRASRAADATHFALQIVRDQVGCYVYPVHRLDRATSGCLLFALDKTMARTLQEAMADPSARKTYVAFVRGQWGRGDEVVRVTHPMKDDNAILKDATSEVERLGTSPDPRCSLLRVRPLSGRFHQVRRHVRDLHHPVVGDGEHGDTRINRWWRETWGFGRLGLHCLSLDLPLPGGERLHATSPLFTDHHDVWTRLPWWSEALAREGALGLPPLPVPDYLVSHAAP